MSLFSIPGRFNRFVQKLLSVKQTVLTDAAAELFWSVPILSGPEDFYLQGWQKFSWGATLAPTGGQTNGMRLRNPKASGSVAVLEKIALWSSVQAQEVDLSLGTADVDLVTGASYTPLDPRQGNFPTQQGAIRVSTSAASPAPENLIQRVITNSAAPSLDLIFTRNQELILLPGIELTITQTVVNVSMYLTAVWRERSLEDSERS